MPIDANTQSNIPVDHNMSPKPPVHQGAGGKRGKGEGRVMRDKCALLCKCGVKIASSANIIVLSITEIYLCVVTSNSDRCALSLTNVRERAYLRIPTIRHFLIF